MIARLKYLTLRHLETVLWYGDNVTVWRCL